MSDSASADSEQVSEVAEPYEPVRVVPTRPDGWPDWLGRRPISAEDRDKIVKGLAADREALAAVERLDEVRFSPLFSTLTIVGFGGGDDPRKVLRVKASINAALRVAAGDRRTSYHATKERIVIGITGPDARERVTLLREQLMRMGRGKRWTITEDLN